MNRNILNRWKKVSFVQHVERDRVLFLYCAGIALFFWIFLKLSGSYESNIEVRLIYNIPEGKCLVYNPPSKVNVTLAAKGWDLLFLNVFKTSSITINLNNRSSSIVNAVEIQSRISDIVGSDKSVKSVYFEQEYIDLELDDLSQKYIPVTEALTIQTQKGYDIVNESILLSPDSIWISGPKLVVDNLDYWPIEQKSFNGLNQSIKETIPLLKSEEYNLDFSSKNISVKIPIEQVIEKQLYVPVQSVNNSDSLMFYPKRVLLTCIVPFDQFDKLTADDFLVVADVDTSASDKPIALVRLSGQSLHARSVRFTPPYVEYNIYSTTED